MRFLPAALLPVLLAGCSNWIDRSPACKLDVYDWSDDLLAHILTGPGDGTFDYDPDDVPRQNLSGSYDYESGDFSWSVNYADDYWLVSTEVEGYGTAFHDGNLDVWYTETHTDILDDTWTDTWRVERKGCDVVAESWMGGSSTSLVRSGSYKDDESYTWEGDLSGYHYFGGMRQNLSRTLGIEADDGSYVQASTAKPEGTSDTTWSGDCYDTGYTCEATEHERFDGGRESSVTILDAGGDVYVVINGDYSYAGVGEEHWSFDDGTECDLVTDAGGDCVYSCSDGSDGSCS